MSTYTYEFNPKRLDTVLKEVNGLLKKDDIFKDRVAFDIWSRLMSALLQGEYVDAVPARLQLHEHVKKKLQSKFQRFKIIIHRLDEVMDKYIPPPDLNASSTSKQKKGKKSEVKTNDHVPNEPVVTKTTIAKKGKIAPVSSKAPDQPREDTVDDKVGLGPESDSLLMRTVEDQQVQLSILQGRADDLERLNLTLKHDLRTMTEEQVEKIKVCSNAEKEIEFLRKELELKDRSLETSLVERNKLLERLDTQSDLAFHPDSPIPSMQGDMTTPTGVADKYSKLYDNEWYDAFQVLTVEHKYEHRAAVQTLLDLLLDIYLFCERTTNGHTKTLTENVLYPFIRTEEMMGVDPYNMDESSRKLLQLLKRSAGRHSVAQIQVQFAKAVRANNKKTFDDKLLGKLMSYVDKGVEVCWYMVLQSPPLFLEDTKTTTKDQPFDRDTYNFYNIAGSRMDYVVWPALFLSNEGVLLAKGVAQPKLGTGGNATTGRDSMATTSRASRIN